MKLIFLKYRNKIARMVKVINAEILIFLKSSFLKKPINKVIKIEISETRASHTILLNIAYRFTNISGRQKKMQNRLSFIKVKWVAKYIKF